MKRHPTSDGQRFGNDDEDIEMIDEFNSAPLQYNGKRFNNDKDYRQQQQQQRTFVNSNQAETNSTRQQPSPIHATTVQHQNSTHDKNIRISDHAINYAADYHYTPFKLIYQPKVPDKKRAVEMINELIQHIKPNFRKENPAFTSDILFDLWWIDSEGDLQILIKTTDLYVFLCNKDRYPKKLVDIEISPIPPSHLPPQYSAIMKFVQNDVQDDDIREEL
ncbi:unnamed protein product [Didymodactylos carnosus]|uniref:Uncharacterized protein n=1 Tax=Didymodactylos carnosus TaxID=1234261 RepID=A0A8S2KD37_9BILA|nr:unnamed protein product [Didymodactylos carnosus]CAF3839760.1 unnamed protein product [Didymodactylos carnosus]